MQSANQGERARLPRDAPVFRGQRFGAKVFG